MRQAVAFKIEGALREMAAAKWPQTRMASALGVSASTVHFSLKKLGIKHGGNCWATREYPTPPIVSALRNARVESGMTRPDLAKISGYHANQISEWERGARQVPLHVLTDLTQALGFDVALVKRAA